MGMASSAKRNSWTLWPWIPRTACSECGHNVFKKPSQGLLWFWSYICVFFHFLEALQGTQCVFPHKLEGIPEPDPQCEFWWFFMQNMMVLGILECSLQHFPTFIQTILYIYIDHKSYQVGALLRWAIGLANWLVTGVITPYIKKI